ncbi:MAG: AraC family transcriptional regulator [Cyanobacteria bacterium J06631_2]
MNNSKSQTVEHPMLCYKDEWVQARKSIFTGGLVVERHVEPPDQVESEATKHHIIAYFLNDLSPRQITRLDGKEYDGELRRGDIWLKPSHSSGFWRWESNDNCLMFAIEPAFLSQVATQNNCANSDRIEVLPVLKTCDPIFDALAIQFQQEMDNAEFGNLMYLESLANQFAIHLLRKYCAFPLKLKEYTGGLSPYKLKQAVEYINDNLEQQVKLKDVAKLIDISQYYFCRSFRTSMGVSPYQYVIQQRVAKAKELIKSSKLPLADIAYSCGFSSQSQMTQHFRKCVGVTPKVYRDRL